MSKNDKKYKDLKRKEAMGDTVDKKKMVILLVIVFGIVALIIAGAIIFDTVNKKEKNEVITSSIGLNEDGKVKNIKVKDYVELCSFDNLNKNVEDYYPDKETEDTYIDGIVNSFPTLVKEEGKKVNMGDTINIDFVAYIGEDEVEGGNTNGAGMKMTLGAAGFPEDFEEQVAGHKIGETVDVNIQFANDFANEELAGQKARYEVTINGYYKVETFGDDFVKKNFGNQISTADEFLEAYRMSAAENAFDSYICKYIISDSTVKKTPSKYKKAVIKLLKDKDQKQFDNMNEAYLNLQGQTIYKDILDMRKMTEKEYEQYLNDQADSEIKTMLVYQALYEELGLSINQDDLYEVAKSYSYEQDEYDQAVERFGEPFIKQQAMFKVVTAYLTENYNLK